MSLIGAWPCAFMYASLIASGSCMKGGEVSERYMPNVRHLPGEYTLCGDNCHALATIVYTWIDYPNRLKYDLICWDIVVKEKT